MPGSRHWVVGVFVVLQGDRFVNDTSAELEFVIAGKNSTAGLPGVCDWPLPGDSCTDDGTAPLVIALGVRYKGGEVCR